MIQDLIRNVLKNTAIYKLEDENCKTFLKTLIYYNKAKEKYNLEYNYFIIKKDEVINKKK